jgi:uncharacterized protein (TIGR02300 family)
VAKPELGTKRVCPSCSTKYYDLNRDPITCPNCGVVFEPAARQRAAAPVRAVAEPELEPDAQVEAAPGEAEEADVISLEEAEEEAVPDVGPEPDEEEDVGIPEDDAEGIEIEADIEAEDSETFLDEEEEAGDDVSGLLDVEAENEDEV